MSLWRYFLSLKQKVKVKDQEKVFPFIRLLAMYFTPTQTASKIDIAKVRQNFCNKSHLFTQSLSYLPELPKQLSVINNAKDKMRWKIHFTAYFRKSHIFNMSFDLYSETETIKRYSRYSFPFLRTWKRWPNKIVKTWRKSRNFVLYLFSVLGHFSFLNALLITTSCIFPGLFIVSRQKT